MSALEPVAPGLAVNVTAMLRALDRAGLGPTDLREFGPCGLSVRVRPRGSVLVTQADHDDGVEWIHASIAWADRTPTYEELALLHAAVFGRRRWSYQVFAPESEHVNIHEHALHIWGRADGASALPEFGRLGTI